MERLKKMGDEHFGERRLAMNDVDDRRFFQPHDDRIRHRDDGRDAALLSGEATFSEKIVRLQNRDDGLFPLG